MYLLLPLRIFLSLYLVSSSLSIEAGSSFRIFEDLLYMYTQESKKLNNSNSIWITRTYMHITKESYIIIMMELGGDNNITSIVWNSSPPAMTMFGNIMKQLLIFLCSPWSFLKSSTFVTTCWFSHDITFLAKPTNY